MKQFEKYIIHHILPILVVLPGILYPQDAGQLLKKAVQTGVSDLDSSNWYATRVLETALSSGNDTMAMKAQFILGKNLQMQGNLPEAVTVYKELIRHAPRGSDQEAYIQAYGRIGDCYTDLGRFDSSMVYLLRFDSLVNTHWSANKIDAKVLLGELYRAMGDMERSDAYKIEAIRRAERSGNEMEQTIALYYYLEDHRHEMHTERFQKYFSDYITLVSEDGRRNRNFSHATMFIEELPEDQKATILKHAIAEGQQYGHTNSLLVFHSALVHHYLDGGRYKEAIPHAENGLSLAQHAGDKLFESDFNRDLYHCHEGLQAYGQAIRYLRRHYEMKDSLETARLEKNLDELNIRYETAKKEQQISAQELALQKSRIQRRALFGGLAMIVWFGGFLVVYLWNRNRVNKKLALQESRISRQKIRELEQEKNLLAMSSMIEGQEAERKRIARDLHDGLGGLLSNVKAQLHAIETRVDALSSMDVYGKASDMVDQASKEVRRIAYNMMPASLTRLGMKAAIEDLAADMANHHDLHVKTQLLDLEERLDESHEIMLYRIVQELCHNVVKHANASELIIQTNRLDDQLILVVEDNGKGFDPIAAKASKGVGMTSLESRVRYLGGELDISSGAEGTCVTVSVPLEQELTSNN